MYTKQICFLVLFFSSNHCFSQGKYGQFTKEQKSNILKIQNLIKINDKLGLSKLILYPIQRFEPFNEIKNATSFIQLYNTLFDSAIRFSIIQTPIDSLYNWETSSTSSLYLESWNHLLVNPKGKIIFINYSKTEEKILDQVDAIIRKRIHPSVIIYSKNRGNMSFYENDKFFIKIDMSVVKQYDSVRYISWKKPKTIEDEPDLILTKGQFLRVQKENQTDDDYASCYSFKNDEFLYELTYEITKSYSNIREDQSKKISYIKVFSEHGRKLILDQKVNEMRYIHLLSDDTFKIKGLFKE